MTEKSGEKTSKKQEKQKQESISIDTGTESNDLIAQYLFLTWANI